MCRCPDCGRYAPGDGVVAPSERVLQRVAVPLVVTWLLVVLGVFGTVGLVTWILHAIFLASQANPSTHGDLQLPLLLMLMTFCLAAVPPAMLACTAAAGSKLRLVLLVLGFQILVALGIECSIAAGARRGLSSGYSYYYASKKLYLMWRYGLYAAAAMGAITPILLARRLSRWVIGSFAPQGVLSYFSYLWTRDGLRVPGTPAAPAGLPGEAAAEPGPVA